MSARTFFNNRYLFPGYTFLLFNILIISDKIYEYVPQGNMDILTVVFGFVYILNGIPAGFLVSQLWYFVFYIGFKGPYGRNRKNPRKYITYLHNKFDININKIISSITALDYLYLEYAGKRKDYVDRRWDIYNILGSTICAIISGLVFGFSIKTRLITTDLYDITRLSAFNYYSIIAGIILSFLIFLSMFKISHEHEEMVLSILHSIPKEKIHHFRTTFPQHFYNIHDNETNTLA